MAKAKRDFGLRPTPRAWFALLLVALLMAGCRTAVAIDVAWPPPPDSPVIRYYRAYRASSDVQGKSKRKFIVNVLLGGTEAIYVVKKPYGVHLDPFDRLLVPDTGWGRILVFDLKNKKFYFLGGDPAGALMKPACVDTDTDGTMYVSDLSLHRVYVYDKDGHFLRGLGAKDRFEQPVGVAVDRERKHVYVVDMKKHQFSIWDTQGNEIKTIGKRGGGNAEFNFPSNVAVAPNGDVYVVDTFNFRVQRFDSEGKFLNMWGKVGNLPGMFSRPKGVAVDKDGHVYIVDAAFHNVQIFTPEGRLLLFFGSPGRGLGEFNLPAGIDIAPDGRIFVTSQLNRRIDMLRYLGAPNIPPEALEKKPAGDVEESDIEEDQESE